MTRKATKSMPAKTKAKRSTKAKVVNNRSGNSSLGIFRSKWGALVVAVVFMAVGLGTLTWTRAATTTHSLWPTSAVPKTITDTDAQAVELGVKFRSKYAGKVTGVRFYKGPQNTGTHVGNLWRTSDRQKLATVTFKNETASGWQTAYFAKPVDVSANTNYVISYFAPKGRYSSDSNYFKSDRTNGPLTAPKSGNGTYAYGSKSSFPNKTYQGSNYWVDVVFSTSRFYPTPSPTAPANLQATVSGSSVKLSWTASVSTGVVNYEIWRDGAFLVGNIANLTYQDNGLTPGKKYSYQVRAVDEGGKSGFSNTASADIPSTTPPPPEPPTTPPTAPPTSSNCPNPKHTPGGPDGMGGCWPYEGNTGVPASLVSQLTPYSGSCTITAAGTVIDKKTVNCNLNIRAKNVTITNSKINGAVIVDSDFCSSYSYSVSDSTIHLNDINLRGLMSCSYTATRVNVSGGQSMAWCDTCTIQDSYLHHPLEDPAGAAANHAAHNSTVRIAKYAIVKHNTLWCFVKEYSQPNGEDTSGCSANQTGYSHDGAAPYNSRIEANLYMPTSGGYCAYGGSTTGALSSVHDIVFVNNVFKRNAYNGQGGPNCGYWGAITSFDSSRPGNQWVNNRWDDGSELKP
jgi:hypothetical protein